MKNDIRILNDRMLYNTVTAEIKKARQYVYIGTADIKDMHIEHKGKVVSFLALLDELAEKGVNIKLLHAKEPGKNFRNSFDRFPRLWKKMERLMCPRVHFKIIIVDGKFAYMGSANLTGAGLGMKNEHRRNFETGLVTGNKEIIDKLIYQFNKVWYGTECKTCQRKPYCPDPIIK